MRRAFCQWMVVGWMVAGLTACSSSVQQPAVSGLTPEQLQLLRAQGFTEQDGDWALLVPSKLLFAVGTDQLEPQQAEYVAGLAKELLRVGIQRVRVEGHTDDTGTPAFNMQLSERRAQRVADVMVRAGMAASQVSIRGWGNTRPLPMVLGQDARRENRRVAIIIPGPAGS